MERKRTFVNCLAILSCLTVFIFVEGRSLSSSTIKHAIDQDNSNLQFHRRSLSAPYDIERCTWMQDSSCQINPRYVRAVLSHSPAFSNEAVLEAVLDEASCLSTTHEAACISQKKCDWNERPSGSMGGTQSHCQYKGSRSLWRRCAIYGLQDFVEEYMVCRRSQGGSCNPDHNCQTVQISATEEGCGLMASRVLDLIIQTPASQTEIISTLVESTKALQKYDVPDLDEILALSSGGPSRDGDERRKLLDDNAVEHILAVDEGLDSASSSTKSVISGTGSAQGEEHDEHSDKEEESSTETTESPSTENSTTSDASTSMTNSTSSEDNSTNNTVLAGSLSFIVPTTTSSDKSKEQSHTDDSNASNDDLQTQINQPLVLTGDITHLTEVDLSISVSLNHVADTLDVLVSLVEEWPWTEGSKNLFNNATRLLEIMRFRLDSQMDSQTVDRTWSGADQVWWKLQHTVQSLDALTLQDSQGLNMNIAMLVETCEIAKTTWTDQKSSEAFSAVLILERRLKDLLQDGSTPDSETESTPDSETESTTKQPDVIESLEELISNVVKNFNRTLFSLYPQQLNINFTRKYKQVWVEILAKRNKKWEDIKTLVSNHSNLAQPVATMLKQLYLVQPTKASFQRNIDSFFELQTLKSLIDELVGALIASRAGKYRIDRLSKTLASHGFQSWQRGPQVTADGLNSAFTKATKEFTANARNSRNTGLPIESMDAMGSHLKALSVLIDSKITKSQNSRVSGMDVRSVPETTGVFLSVETALNTLMKWTHFSQAQNGQEQQNFYGNQTTTDFALSLAGCLVLAPEGDGKCRGLDKTPCTGMKILYWSVSSGVITNLESELICAPEGSEQKVSQLLHAPKQVSTKLAKPVADLFYITAYCPTLSKADCLKNEKCSMQMRLDEEVCRPSANIVNYHVEGSNITGLAAREESCRSYLGFPVCTNLLTQTACNASESCRWIELHHDEDSESQNNGMCLTNWAQQLFQLNSTTIDDNLQFYEDISNCQEQLGEASCGIYGLEGEEATVMSQASLPKSNSKFRPWIVSCLTVLVTILFLMVVYISCKIHKSRQTPSKLVRSKKGRGRKPKGESSSTRPPPFQMYSHVFELSPYGSPPSQKKTASFPYDVNALENADTGSQSSRLRVPSQQDHPRLETYTSATTAEISEIQPISEVDEIKPVSESESEDSWSSTDGWSEDSEENSVHGSGSAPQGAPSPRV